jgi:hypothetical protein
MTGLSTKQQIKVEDTHRTLIALSFLPICTSCAYLAGAAKRIFVPMTKTSRVTFTTFAACASYAAAPTTIGGTH